MTTEDTLFRWFRRYGGLLYVVLMAVHINSLARWIWRWLAGDAVDFIFVVVDLFVIALMWDALRWWAKIWRLWPENAVDETEKEKP